MQLACSLLKNGVFWGGNKSIFNDYSLLIELCRLALCIFFQVFSYDRVYCEA